MFVNVLGLAALLAFAPQEKSDTTIAVDRDTRLELENFAGTVDIRTWTRSEVKIEAVHSSRERLDVRNSLLRLHVETNNDFNDDDDSRRNRRSHATGSRVVDYTITVPESMPISVSGPHTDVKIEGVKGDVNVETVQGEITVRGGSGNVNLESVQGAITLTGARGHINVHTVNEEVHLINVSGDINAESVSGDVHIEGAQAESLDATTVSGELSYEGSIRDGGRYIMESHSGDVRMTIPESSNATVAVSTFSGDFQAGFPVRLTDTRQKGKRFSFTVGNGSARVEMESFSGDIEVLSKQKSQ